MLTKNVHATVRGRGPSPGLRVFTSIRAVRSTRNLKKRNANVSLRVSQFSTRVKTESCDDENTFFIHPRCLNDPYEIKNNNVRTDNTEMFA